VTDLSRASARGDGLTQVKAGQLATFYICAPAAQLKDISVTICGMWQPDVCFCGARKREYLLLSNTRDIRDHHISINSAALAEPSPLFDFN